VTKIASVNFIGYQQRLEHLFNALKRAPKKLPIESIDVGPASDNMIFNCGHREKIYDELSLYARQ